MKTKRSYFHLLLGSAGVALLLANCTIKEGDPDQDESCEKGDKDLGCKCPGGLTGYQVCNSDGVFGECVCPDDTSGGGTESGTGGKSSTGGTSEEGGKSSTGGSEPKGGTTNGTNGGEGGALTGEGGALPTFEDCSDCLDALCQKEFDACFDDPACISEDVDGTGQYERIAKCIENERFNGLVKRDKVRGCGVTVGDNPDPNLDLPWPPEGMVPTATNLLNCLATSSKETPNADWANDDDNFLNANGDLELAPWPEDSCAKLACTSEKQ
jgi:hypothetical protein